MQSPLSMALFIVLSPLGLVLVFTAAITPQWREGQVRMAVSGSGAALQGLRANKAGTEAVLLIRSDGLWETCLQMSTLEIKQCWPVSGAYQKDPRVRLAQGLTLTSLFLCGIGIVLSCIGVRCWKDLPLRGVAATGGLLMALASALVMIALSVYSENLKQLGFQEQSSSVHASQSNKLNLHESRSVVIGWLGSLMQMTSGVALMVSFKRPKCPTCPAELPTSPALSSPDISNKTNTDVYEVNC